MQLSFYTPVANPTIQPFLDYLKFEKRYSPHTVSAYENDLVDFFDYMVTQFDAPALSEISHTLIRSWLADRKDKFDFTAKTINRKISSLRSFFKYQVKTGLLEQTPMTKVIAPKIEKRLPQFVADKDIKTLFNHVEFNDDWKGKTQRLLLQLFYQTGMRRAEVIDLKDHNVNAATRTLKVLGKGNKERIIPINAELLSDLQEYIAEKKRDIETPAPNVFVTAKGKPLNPRTVYTYVNDKLKEVTTIEKKSPHVLRHTFATHLTNNGAELNAIKELLGHSSLAATQVYTHNSIEKLKNIHKNFHPKA